MSTTEERRQQMRTYTSARNASLRERGICTSCQIVAVSQGSRGSECPSCASARALKRKQRTPPVVKLPYKAIPEPSENETDWLLESFAWTLANQADHSDSDLLEALTALT